MTQTNHLNLVPVKGGISPYYSPRAILGAPVLDYNKHCTIPFGAYVQAKHESEPTNDNTAHTIDCIYLRPCTNLQGGHELMDLNSGRVITRCKVTEIPITKDVIDAVECMAEKKGFKVSECLVFVKLKHLKLDRILPLRVVCTLVDLNSMFVITGDFIAILVFRSTAIGA